MARLTSVIVLVVVAACHGPLNVRIDPAAADRVEWLRAPDARDRAIEAADESARAWDGSPSDLDGWTIVLSNHAECDGAKVQGCAEPSLLGGGTLTVDVTSHYCVETTVLWHEVGHALIGDGDHRDMRWISAAFRTRELEPSLSGSIPVADAACAQELAGAISPLANDYHTAKPAPPQ